MLKRFLGPNPAGNFLPVNAQDGYFTNIDCPNGSGILCRPPIVSLSAPSSAFAGNSVAFDASGGSSQNPNGVITRYVWVWAFGLDRSFLTTTSPITTHTFPFPLIGVWTVTLTVQDNYGTSAIETLLVTVTPNPLKVSTSIFFTDSDLNYLPPAEVFFCFPLCPQVNVTISGGVVRNVSPRNVLAWVNVTNSGDVPIQSVKLNESLPPDWIVNLPSLSGKGGVRVYYANTTSLATNPEITQRSTITVLTGSPESIQLVIPNFNATKIAHPLMPGKSILLSVNLSYSLIGTSQSAATYPRFYVSRANVDAWETAGFVGNKSAYMDFAVFVAVVTNVGHGSQRPTVV